MAVKTLADDTEPHYTTISNFSFNRFVPQLLTEQIKILRTFMMVENLNEERLNEIKFEMDRDKAFFKRQLRQLEELNGIT